MWEESIYFYIPIYLQLPYSGLVKSTLVPKCTLQYSQSPKTREKVVVFCLSILADFIYKTDAKQT